MTHRLQPARDRLRARPPHRRPERRQARGRHRAPQPLAPPAAPRGAARGGAAEEHPDDRPDRHRQDRDRAPPRQAGAGALPQGRGDQVHRGRLCRPRRRADRARPGRGRARHDARAAAQGSGGARPSFGAEERVLDVLVGANASPETRAKFRKMLRTGELDEREIEVEVQDQGGLQHADLRHPRHARRADGHGQSRRDVRQGVRAAAPSRAA